MNSEEIKYVAYIRGPEGPMGATGPVGSGLSGANFSFPLIFDSGANTLSVDLNYLSGAFLPFVSGSNFTLKISTPNSAPTGSSFAGERGLRYYSSGFIYECVDVNTWIRYSVATNFSI